MWHEVAMRRVNVREMRELLPRIEATLQDEGELALMRRGKAVARIVPLEEPASALLSTQALRAHDTPAGAERGADPAGSRRAVSGCCLDTSALAKWYLEEPGSSAFEAFVNRTPDRTISRLVMVKLRCLLARRRGAREIGSDHEARAWATFTAHAAGGVLAVGPVPDLRLHEARELIEALPEIPLRTLEAVMD
jgi:antitoxin (DNA-binding transcriptional repressor) of toxin-antitoxin stability system